MSKGSEKLGDKQVLTKRLGVAAAVLIAALMALTMIPTSVANAAPQTPCLPWISRQFRDPDEIRHLNHRNH